MKKIFFVVSAFACCIFISCNNNNNNKNISLAHDIFKGIETGDSNKLSAIAANAVDHSGPFGEVTNGDSIKAYLLDIHNHIKDLKIEILGDAADGDYVYSWNRMSGTALDSVMGFPPNLPFSVSGVDIVKFENGKATEHWGTIDQKDLMTMHAQQMPNATTVKIVVGDTSENKKDTTKK